MNLLDSFLKKYIYKTSKERDYDGEILNLLKFLTDNELKKKVIIYLNKLVKNNDDSENNISYILNKNKKLTFNYIEYILLLANKLNETDFLNEYLISPTVTYDDLKNNNTLSILFKDISFSDTFKKSLIQTHGRGIGKGEIALVTFIKDCELLGGRRGEIKGDIKIGSINIEIKGRSGSLVPFDILKYGNKPLLELKREFGEEIKQGEKWPVTLQNIYNNSSNKKEITNKINNIIKNFYPEKIALLNEDDLSNMLLINYITDALAKEYIKGKHVLFIDKNGEKYKIIENYEEYKQIRDSGELIISAFSDKFPRLSYTIK